MNQNVYLKQYQKNNIETATPAELFLILFNALVNFVAKAKNAMEEANIQDTHNNITKAQNILIEFVETLDHSVSPELAKNLESLYMYNIKLLTDANIKKDIKKLNESYKLLEGLRNTWREAMEIQKNSKSKEDSLEDSYTSVRPSEDENYEGYEFDG